MKLRNMNAYVTEENITIELESGEVLDLEKRACSSQLF